MTALVTGAARGIGAAVAAALAGDGNPVVLTDVLDEDGADTAKRLGEHAAYRHLDVTDERAWASVVARVQEEFGPIGVLVNNAGIVDFGTVESHSVASFRRILDVNLMGALFGIRAVAPAMRASGGGVIVNMSSTAGMTGYGGVSGYVASKWALRGLTKTAAIDLAPDGIRVCSVHPGPIHTPMTAGMDEPSIVAGQLIPRFGEPEEVADTVHFIVTRATFTTGAEYLVDGGTLAGSALPLDQ